MASGDSAQMCIRDRLYLHMWDYSTRPEEVLRGLDDLVRAGKVLYVGISDTPAWVVSRAQAIACLLYTSRDRPGQ